MRNWPASSPAAAVPLPDAARELLRRRQARQSLHEFVTYTHREYASNWHHRLLCRQLDRVVSGELKRLIVCMPPRHGKSEVVSRRLPAYLLGRNPNLRVLACSHTVGLAASMNRDVQRVMDDAPYQRLFPESRLIGKSIRQAAGPMPLRNSEVFEIVDHGGVYRAAGVGTAIAGHGFDVGIIDDPMAGREEADSPACREAVWKWYTGDFYTRRAPGAAIIVVSTRWHPEDLVGRLLSHAEEDPNADQWELVILPAIAEEARHPEDPREPGEALWPERYPVDDLEKIRAASSYDWWSQYQQRPRAPGSTEWPDDFFGWPGFWFDEWPSNMLLKVMALDPSKGVGSKNADYQALILYGRTPDGMEWIEADMGRRPLLAQRAGDKTAMGEGMVETSLERYTAFRPEGMAIETNTFQQLLVPAYRTVAELMGIADSLRIYQVDNVSPSKEVRIRRLGDPLSRRQMRFRRTPGTRILVEQLKQFPCASHDDGPDALEMARRVAIELWNGRTAQKGRTAYNRAGV